MYIIYHLFTLLFFDNVNDEFFSSLPELLEKKRLVDMHMNVATAMLEHIKVSLVFASLLTLNFCFLKRILLPQTFYF